jgi:hypothetical protein
MASEGNTGTQTEFITHKRRNREPLDLKAILSYTA